MNKKSWTKIALDLLVVCLSIYAAFPTGFAEACSGDAQCGQWQSVMSNWPNYAVHAALVVTGNPSDPTTWAGKVLFWGDDSYDGTDTTEIIKLWDPNPPCGTDAASCFQAVPLTIPNSGGDIMYGSGHSFLQDGKLLVAGGDSVIISGGGPRHTFWFDPFADLSVSPFGWTTRALLNDPVCLGDTCIDGGRYHPTNVTIKHPSFAAAQVLSIHGLDKFGIQGNQSVERYNAAANSWTVDSINIPINPINTLYPWLHLLPSAASPTVFFSGSYAPNSRFAHRYDVVSGAWTSVGAERTLNRQNGASVLLPLAEGEGGRVLVIGGTDQQGVTETAEFICFTPLHSTCTIGHERWLPIESMANPRQHANAVILPDGNVLEVGGQSISCKNDITDCPNTPPGNCVPVYEAELLNPTTMTWTQLPAMTRPRQYHSTATLLPDGSVLAAGGETDQRCFCSGPNVVCPSAQVYKPGYFFRPNDAARPTVTDISARIVSYDQQFVVTINQTVNGDTKVVLIRPSAMTHSFNMEQRSVELAVVTRGSNTITVRAPSNPNLAPPGFYMLFVVNQGAQGALPSKAKFIQLLP